jgi:hypothetical protein
VVAGAGRTTERASETEYISLVLLTCSLPQRFFFLLWQDLQSI